jgi:hypothetical protein
MLPRQGNAYLPVRWNDSATAPARKIHLAEAVDALQHPHRVGKYS